MCGRLCKLPACNNFNNGRVRWLVKQHTCRAYCQAGRARRSQQILSLRRCPCWIGLLLHVIVLSGGASRCACIMLIGFSCVCRGVTCMRRLVQCVCPGTKSASLPAVTPVEEAMRRSCPSYPTHVHDMCLRNFSFSYFSRTPNCDRLVDGLRDGQREDRHKAVAYRPIARL